MFEVVLVCPGFVLTVCPLITRYPFVGLIELVVCLIWFKIIGSLGLSVLAHV